ncbi:50S ribosomal protein L23 [Candidatus Babeliales bacterium]|nr:50S ribosomal protein L23 [Candidatus Babeliales bacterium]
MKLEAYDIVKKAVVTAKSRRMFDDLGKITFEVSRYANKIMVRKAVEQIWGVKVANVALMNVKGRKKKFSGKVFFTSSRKKAIISLKKGYKIDMPWQYEQTPQETSPTVEAK